MVAAIAEADEVERGRGIHRAFGDVGDEANIFLGRQAGNQIVELEDEPDFGAPETGQLRIVHRG